MITFDQLHDIIKVETEILLIHIMSIPFIDLKTQYNHNKSDIDDAIHRVLDHGQYIMGPEVKELEEKLADYIGVNFALTCSSGTDALLLPLMANGIENGDIVFTTPFTFFASAESITLAGGTPVFVDIDPNTYNLCPQDLEEKIKAAISSGKNRLRAIMPVDLFGLAADYQQINDIAEKYDLIVIEDAAQAFGAPYSNKKACGLGDVAATSFYPAKPLGCYGDGGAVFTNDQELYEKMLSIRVHGQGVSGDKYDNIRIGLNARMDTIQAAILIEKLKNYDNEIELRNKVASTYTNNLDSAVKTPTVPENQGCVWAQYSIQVDDRQKLQSDLKEKGIPTATFYPTPIHLSTAYNHLGYKKGDFPVSEAIAERIVSLPMHPYLDEKQILNITNAVNESVRNTD